ncbi:transposase [Chloroflexota bacterium]
MGEKTRDTLKLQFDKRLRLGFHGARITSDAGLLACRELDVVLGLMEMAPTYLQENRGGRNVQHEFVPLLRQSVYSRLAGYEDTNDAVRLARDPAMQAVVGRRAMEKQAASSNTMSRFETEDLVTEENLRGLEQLNTQWEDHAMAQTSHQRVILDMDSSESPVYGEREGAAYNGPFETVCYHPLFLFNEFGDREGAMLRSVNVHSTERWRQVLEPIVERYRKTGVRLQFSSLLLPLVTFIIIA